MALALGLAPVGKRRRPSADFELPEDISEDDEILLTGILAALCSLELCSGYQVQVAPPTAFVIRGTLHGEAFEVDMEDLQFIHTASPLRIQRIAVARCGAANELVVRVLNSKQRIMLTDATTFYVSSRRRRASRIAADPPLNKKGSLDGT
jgi:hypothetical protein